MPRSEETIKTLKSWQPRLSDLGFGHRARIEPEISIYYLTYGIGRIGIGQGTDERKSMGLLSFMPVNRLESLRTAYPVNLPAIKPGLSYHTYRTVAEIDSYFTYLEDQLASTPYARVTDVPLALVIYNTENEWGRPEDYPYADCLSALGVAEGSTRDALHLLREGFTKDIAAAYDGMPKNYIREIYSMSQHVTISDL